MPGTATDDAAGEEVSPTEAKLAIEKYAAAVERRLKPGLDAACALRDKAFEQLAEIDQMEKALDVLDLAAAAAEQAMVDGRPVLNESGRPMPSLETKVNIGEEFYMNAHVHQIDPLIVDVGLGVRVEMSRSETRDYVAKRKGMLEVQAEKHTKRIAEVQAHLQAVMQHLSDLKIATYATGIMENE